MPSTLTHNSYGKSAVRLTKVVRNGLLHDLFEIDAAIQLEGDFGAAYRDGDNRNVVATDTIKNTVYVLAKENAFDSIERFAVILANYFPRQYPWVTKATIELHQSAWRRIDVNGKPHDHAFTSDGPQQFFAKSAWADGNLQPLVGGIRGLLVLKTTASEWRDFHTDRYRTLKDTRDRIMATRVDADWTYNTTEADFPAAGRTVRQAILTTFATHYSLGVQQTLLAMGEAALAACPAIDRISFELPNLHRIPFNLEPFGLKFDNDVFVATDEPFGLIKGTVERSPERKPQ
jgi:urate oxidase